MNKQNFTIVSFILVFVVLCTIEAVPARGCNTTVIANDLPDVEPIKYRDEYSFIGRISDNLPKLEITVADTGIYSGTCAGGIVISLVLFRWQKRMRRFYCGRWKIFSDADTVGACQ